MKVIGDGCVKIGKNTSIDESVTVIFNKNKSNLVLEDYVTIGCNVKIIVEDGDVYVGEWSTIHANCLLLCKEYLKIGQHCWFGQNTILDGSGGLEIENGVRVGMYSQIWTHVAAGEQIEGCKLFSAKPTHIHKDAWLVGSCVVGSGLEIGQRSICMNGSNVTKSIPSNVTAMGSPAKVRDGLVFYKEISLDDKFNLMKNWVVEFAEINRLSVEADESQIVICDAKDKLVVYKFCSAFDRELQRGCNDSLFCIENKKYSKKYARLEEKFIKYLCGNKARFYSV